MVLVFLKVEPLDLVVLEPLDLVEVELLDQKELIPEEP
jgi:hypothetical protein